MATEIQVSSDELSNEGYSALAVKTPDNKLDASRLDTEAAREEAAKLARALNDKTSKIQGVTAADLSALLQEAEKNDKTSGGDDENKSPEGTETPSPIKAAADAARVQVKSVFKIPNEQYISNFKQALGKIPGYEPATLQDISDALYQSQDFTLRFISWLEQEASNNSLTLDTSGDPGLWPFTTEKTTFSTVEEKQEYIKNMLDGLKHAFDGKEAGAGMMDGILLWILAGGGTLVGVVAGTILTFKAGKWIIVKSLGKAGSAIIGVLEGVTGKTLSVGKAAAVKAGATGANIVRSGLQATPITSGGIPNVAFRELDMTKNIEKAVHNGIIEEIYKAQNTGTSPTPDQAKTLSDSIKSGIASPSEIAEYQSRVTKYLSLPQPPLGDPKKIAEYNANVERAIKGEKDPSKWNLKAKAAVKGAVTTNEAAYRARLATVVRDATGEKLTIGNIEAELKVGAKTPIEEIHNISEQIKEKKAKITELEGAKKKLEVRLKDEKAYHEASKILSTAISDEATLRTEWEAASSETANKIRLDGEGSPAHKAAQRIELSKETAYKSLVESIKNAKSTKITLESKYTDINKGIGIKSDASGNFSDSYAKQQIEGPLDPSNPNKGGVKAKIAAVNSEIVVLEGELDAKLASLHTIDPTVPNKWNKTGINIGTERVTDVSRLVEALIKKFKK